MDILGKARKLESTLTRTLDRAAQHWAQSGPREPLEILQAVLDAIAERAEPAGRDRTVFPFNRITVSVLAPSREARARFSAILETAPTLTDRISKRLVDAGCHAGAMQVTTVYAMRPESHWREGDFHVDFDRLAVSDVPAPKQGGTVDTLRLTVVHGAAGEPAYAFSLARVNLGRCAEVRDSRNRLLRTNHVAFTETSDGPNQTVSRHHAHIEYVSASHHYRICDDRSAHGTSIIRGGRTITVPSGSRGVRLASGDELLLGEARLLVALGNPDRPI